MKINPEWENATFELSYLDKDSKLIAVSNPYPLRFSEENIPKVHTLLKERKFNELHELAIPTFLE